MHYEIRLSSSTDKQNMSGEQKKSSDKVINLSHSMDGENVTEK